MQKQGFRRDYFVLGVIIALFVFVSVLSIKSLQQLQGNTRIVNFVGIVRGATQRLVKEEIMNTWDDQLIEYLDSIISELLSGNGAYKLHVLNDKVYLSNMKKVEQKWDLLKQEIRERRSSGNPWPLFYSSQEYYILVNETAFSAELFSERQLIRSIGILSGAIIIFFIFVIFSLIYYKWSISIRNRAETLNQIAFIDPLTKIPNRAGCEQFIKEVKETSSGENLTAIMFDMNNLKIINDFLGHSEGDKIIANFASILYNEVKDHGFIGRYGGDEFLAVFKNKNQTDIESFLLNINKRIGAHNNLCPNELQKISFSAGHVIDNTLQTDIEEMIKRADKKLYVQRWRKVEGT